MTPSGSDDVAALYTRIRALDRRALARGITLVESRRDDDQGRAQALLDLALPDSGQALRVGISGTPGVGKSTFIETLGMFLVAQGRRVAVLAVDPSSPTSGGSILGDKTRMERLSREAQAFIRPSPTGGALGGVAARTREAMLLCEAAGFDTVLIETVGVGQSEHAVSSIVDTFVLLVSPGGGDDLQGVKRGILELVDVVVINKADGPRVDEAKKTADDYRVAGQLFVRQGWIPPVLVMSALEDSGIPGVWQAVIEHRAAIEASLKERRAAQAETWLWRVVEEDVVRELRRSPAVAVLLPTILKNVQAGRLSPGRGAERLVQAFTTSSS